MDAEQLIRRYLVEKHMMQLATVNGDRPWCCTVTFVADEDLNIYWSSLPSRRHSQEVANHSKVAAAIPVKHANGEKVIGIQVEGDAEIVESKDAIRPIAIQYAEKLHRQPQWIEDFSNLKTEHRLYRLKPRLFVLFDEVNFPHNTRVEWRPN